MFFMNGPQVVVYMHVDFRQIAGMTDCILSLKSRLLRRLIDVSFPNPIRICLDIPMCHVLSQLFPQSFSCNKTESENMSSQRAETIESANNVLPTSCLREAKNENHCLPLASLHLLKEYENTGKCIRQETVNTFNSNISCSPSQEVSTVGIMKMARATLLQCSSKISDVAFIVASEIVHANNPSLPSDKYEDFELALLLQAAALKFSNKQFDRAKKLLGFCQPLASPTGNPLHRVVYYFAKALQERIAKEIGEVDLQEAPEGIQRKPTLKEAFLSLQPAAIACQYEIPFCQVFQFTAIQAILENVGSAKRIHMVDLGIISVSDWPIMMQALADRHECPLELLKITAVGAGTSEERIVAIGKMLSSFAETMNIPFKFKLVVSEMRDLKEDSFELAADEVVVVHSRACLSSLLAWPDQLESLLRTIKKLNPCVMLMTEIEAVTNTPFFMDCFNSALPIYTAIFDCLEDCMDRDNQNRLIIEEIFLWEGIQNLITTEGEQMNYRKEGIEFWRDFLTRFGMIEIGLSDRSLCQAKLLLKNNPSWSPCALEVSGKGLTIGWKGTPINIFTTWKFHHE